MARAKNGTVSVYPSRGRLFYRWTEEKKRRQAPTGLGDNATNRAVAARIAQRMTDDLRLGIFDHTLERYAVPKRKSGGPNLGELWRGYLEVKKRRLAPSTQRFYGVLDGHVQALPSHRLEDAGEVFRFIIERHPEHIAYRLTTLLSAACEWGLKTGQIRTNPWEHLRAPKPESEPDPHPFTLEERDLILAALEGHHYRAFIEFLFRTGCRIGEAAALQWGNVRGDEVTFLATVSRAQGGRYRRLHLKSQRRRRVPLDAKTKALLDGLRPEQTAGDALVFTSPKGRMVNGDHLNRTLWRPLLAKLGLEDRSLYQTRSTFITAALRRGMAVQDVAALVGNSPGMIFRHYAGVAQDLRLPEL